VGASHMAETAVQRREGQQRRVRYGCAQGQDSRVAMVPDQLKHPRLAGHQSRTVLGALRFAPLRRLCLKFLHIESGPGPRADHAAILQQLARLHGRGQAHAELLGELADPGEAITRTVDAVLDLLRDLSGNVFVEPLESSVASFIAFHHFQYIREDRKL